MDYIPSQENIALETPLRAAQARVAQARAELERALAGEEAAFQEFSRLLTGNFAPTERKHEIRNQA